MSGELEEMFDAFLNNRVPPKWTAAAYPSLKPLASWVSDLRDRMAFMDAWTRAGAPKSFSLPSIFFTQGFLTGVLQKHARKHVIPIDSLDFSFAVTAFKQPEEVSEAAADGCYVHGLFVEAATWDDDTGQLQPALPGAMYAALPLVLFLPRPVGDAAGEELRFYDCPLYRTSVRKGVLTTTGASSNYVLDIRLPIRREASFFVLQGTAALCSLND
jgi:dynein heavy chain